MLEPLLKLLETDPPDVMYLIGIGAGTEVPILSQRFPKLKFFGCEPSSLHDVWWFPGCSLKTCISERQEYRAIYSTKAGTPSGSISLIKGSDGRFLENVPSLSLDQFDTWAGGTGSNILLWADVEGSELEVLNSGTHLLNSGRVKWINVETRAKNDAPEGWSCQREVCDFLWGYGFKSDLEYGHNSPHFDVLFRSFRS